MLQHLLFLRPSIEGVSVTTENLVFKLIYAVTCPLFLAFGVIFYTRVCFTDPINCVCNSTESFKVLRAIDSYCLENAYVQNIRPRYNFHAKEDSDSVKIDGFEFQEDQDRIYQPQYQYMGLFFVLCGALCYLPYVLWEWFENGLLKSLLQDLMSVLVSEENSQKEKMQLQIRNLREFWIKNKGMMGTYAVANVFCEFLNLACITTIFLLGNGLLGDFVTLGLRTSGSGSYNVMFPKLANCTWSTVGPMGNPVAYAGVCNMNLNYLSEKMFYVMWWWLATCGILCLENLVYRHTLYRNEDLRTWLITEGHLYIFGRGETSKKSQERTKYASYLKALDYGEFFMLKRIQANVPPDTFRSILGELSKPTQIDKQMDGSSEQ